MTFQNMRKETAILKMKKFINQYDIRLGLNTKKKFDLVISLGYYIIFILMK